MLDETKKKWFHSLKFKHLEAVETAGMYFSHYSYITA